MKRFRYMCRYFFIVYKMKSIFLSILISLILSLPLCIKKDNFLDNIGSFFNGILVIEIAYIAIFYSGTKGTERAKQLIINHHNNFNYYHYLLVKNYFSILIKFFVLSIIYIINIYNISNIGVEYNLFNINLYISIYNFIQMLSICAILTTMDLILSMFFFLWGN